MPRLRRPIAAYLLSTALVLGLLLVAAGIAMAGTQGSCSGGDTEKVLLWENKIGDTSDNNDNLWKCTGDSTLVNDTHTLPGNCKWIYTPFGTGDWNDCVSSVSIWLPSGRKVCFYANINYDNEIGGGATRTGPLSGTRYDHSFHDMMSSLTFLPAAEPCEE